MLLFIHILASSIWLGTAVTLPFWGNRMNRADHLHTVLGIIDTVFILKCIFIMGGLMSTLTTGFMLANQYYGTLIVSAESATWLFSAQMLSLIIFINSWVIFYFLLAGRRGKRSLMRMVPPIGYTNIGLITLIIFLMVTKPVASNLPMVLGIPLTLIAIANLINLTVKLNKRNKLKTMSAKSFVDIYFSLLNEEKMTDLLKLFCDDVHFYDPFATKPVIGILALEQFFQKLGDQFDSIKIIPYQVSGSANDILIYWEAQGITKNGISMQKLSGINKMKRKNGKIAEVNIDFNLDDLPQIQRVTV